MVGYAILVIIPNRKRYCSSKFDPSFTRARPLVKKTASLIKIETFGARFGNRPLLGFAFRNNTDKM